MQPTITQYQTVQLAVTGVHYQISGGGLHCKMLHIVQNFKDGLPLSDPFETFETITKYEAGQLCGGN